MNLKFYFLFFIFWSCSPDFSERDIIGSYAGNFSNHYDTIVFFDDHFYNRKIYSKDSILIFKNTGNWQKIENRILIKNFLQNNNNLPTGIKYDERDLVTGFLSIRKNNGIIEIVENHNKNFYFRKINN